MIGYLTQRYIRYLKSVKIFQKIGIKNVRNKYLFILSPPFSGSSILTQTCATSESISVVNQYDNFEGQFLPIARLWMRKHPWRESYRMPWHTIKFIWRCFWDLSKPVLIEKSPPNLLANRAEIIDRIFPNAYFICLIRDPYAFVEGCVRRKIYNHQDAAKFWLLCADNQVTNIESRGKVLSVKYEEFVNDPIQTLEKIKIFIPELADINLPKSFGIHNVEGLKKTELKDFNEIKKNNLTSENIQDINAVLSNRKDILGYFGYRILDNN